MMITFMLMAMMIATEPYACSWCVSAKVYPVVVVPGAGGNQLEGRLTAEYKGSSWACGKWYPLNKEEGGWFRLWFDAGILLAPFTQCFAQRMMLYYDPDTDDYCNAPGVQTRVSHFGSTQSLLYLNPHLKDITSYMAPLVESLGEVGYRDGENLFGAPYDFRYGLASQGHPCRVGSKFLQDLKELIENASAANDGKPVILIGHSLGGLFLLQLLNRNSYSWRQQYIKHLVSLSTPWGGTVDEMLTFASGNALGVPLVNPLLVRDEQRSSESNLWLMPRPRQFGSTKPLVVTPNSTYSSAEVSRFLQDIGFPQGVLPYQTRVLPLVQSPLEPPGVPVTCFVGSGVQTPETLFYGEGGFDKQPEILYGDGDGTVNMVSLLALQDEWGQGNHQNQTLNTIKLPGISHTGILKDQTSLARILHEITSINHAIHFTT